MLQGVTNNASPSTLPSTSQNASDLKNEFLTLLLTPLKNQDPSQPVDDTQMVAEQAQFANLEQSQNINTQLTTLLAQQNVSQATNMIGRTITGTDSTGATESGAVTGVAFPGGISTLTVDLGNVSTTQVTLPNVTAVNQ